MKVAYLIMAHDQPEHVAELVRALRSDNATFFVHVDRKSELGPFLEQIEDTGDIHFLDDSQRVRVNWGGFTQVQATLKMLEAALAQAVRFDRFCLISGADYPLQTAAEIEKAFASDREFMRVDRLLDDSCPRFLRYVAYYQFMDCRAYKLLRKLKIRRKVYDRLPLYHGSSWWALTGSCVAFIMRYLGENPDYVRFFRLTRSSDEIFFHSIVKHSPYAANLLQDVEQLQPDELPAFAANRQHGCHYIDWHATGEALPKVLDQADSAALAGSPALFARKMRMPRSAALVADLQRQLGHRS